MKRVSVVTSFLTNDGKILILRRSDRVRIMKQLWAGISGYLEPEESPIERALSEILEETSVKKDDLGLVKQGETLEVPDAEHDTLWIVHPFLFRTKSMQIKLDWEHDEYRWIDPADIVQYDTVPMLKETLDRCL